MSICGVYIGQSGDAIHIGNTARKIISMPVIQEQYQEQEQDIEIPKFMQYQCDNARWHYIDLKRFEEKIRQDERRQVYGKCRAYRQKEKTEEAVDRYNFLMLLIQKFIGIAIVILTVLLCKSGLLYDAVTGINDCTFAILSIPFGVWMIFTKCHVFYEPEEYIK